MFLMLSVNKTLMSGPERRKLNKSFNALCFTILYLFRKKTSDKSCPTQNTNENRYDCKIKVAHSGQSFCLNSDMEFSSEISIEICLVSLGMELDSVQFLFYCWYSLINVQLKWSALWIQHDNAY